MKILVTLVLALLGGIAWGQSPADTIYLHEKKPIAGKILRVSEYTIVFQHVDEDAEQVLGKYAIEKLVYGKSGRVQLVTEYVQIEDEDDWAKVAIIENAEELAGLDRVGEIAGKNALFNYRTGAGADKIALRNLRKKAAQLKCRFILITADRDLNYASNSMGMGGIGLGGVQSFKRGIAYKY